MQGALASLGRLQRTPLPTLMTVAVIAIALALPGSLFVFTRNLEQLSGSWERTAAISVFLRAEVDMGQARQLSGRLGELPEVSGVTLAQTAIVSGPGELMGAVPRRGTPRRPRRGPARQSRDRRVAEGHLRASSDSRDIR